MSIRTALSGVAAAAHLLFTPACDRPPEQSPPPSSQPQTDAPSPETPAIRNAESLAEAGRHSDAIAEITDAEIRYGKSDALSQAFERIYDSSPDYNAAPRRMENDTDVTAVKRLGGGSTLVYRVIKDKKTYAAFKPRQTRKQSNPTAEIAAYRLCPLIRCRFDIPRNVPVFFEYKQFSGLYARLPSNPPGEFGDLIPAKRPDGTDTVTGTLKDWVAEYAKFPIELEDLWRPWFDAPKDALKTTPAADAFTGLSLPDNGTNKLKKQLGSTTAYDVALQISNMFVFDFLINNWDRYSRKKEFYGSNCQFAAGRFNSIDNGAAFSQTPSDIPRQHFYSISRFSRLTYETIRQLDRDSTLRRLFPQASPNDLKRFDTFWSQRQLYLDQISSLISKNGEEQTLFFD